MARTSSSDLTRGVNVSVGVFLGIGLLYVGALVLLFVGAVMIVVGLVRIVLEVRRIVGESRTPRGYDAALAAAGRYRTELDAAEQHQRHARPNQRGTSAASVSDRR